MQKQKSSSMIFIIIIPLIVVALAFIFDNAIKIVESKRLEVITKDIIKDCLSIHVNDYYEKVKEDYEKKKISTDQLFVKYEDDALYISNSHTFVSFFGKIFNISDYRTHINVKGTLVDKEIVYEDVEYEWDDE